MLDIQEDRAHFSYSQLMTMLSCPYKYYLSYIEGREWDFLPSSVSFGSAIHESVSDFHRALANGGAEDNAKYTDAFRELFIEDADERDIMFRDDAEFDELLAKGEALVTEYVDSFQHLKPQEVEMEFRLPLVNTFTGELVDKDIVGRYRHDLRGR
jgi:putative RecB family exonuclease